jgi:hypothetical protein
MPADVAAAVSADQVALEIKEEAAKPAGKMKRKKSAFAKRNPVGAVEGLTFGCEQQQQQQQQQQQEEQHMG